MDAEYLRVGDAVYIERSGSWDRGDGFVGQELIVTGFGHMVVGHITHGYTMGETAPRPGIYLDPTHVSVATATGISATHHYWHQTVKLADHEEAARRGPRPVTEPPIFVSELPDTDFWVGDSVMLSFAHSSERQIVTAVDYFGCSANGGHLPDHVGAYLLGRALQPELITSTTRLKPSKRLRLLERGNIWRYHHAEPATFNSPREEFLFHILMGWFAIIGLPLQSKHKAIELTKTGEIDGYFSTGGNETSPAWKLYPIKLHDSRIGQSHRKALNEGFVPIHLP